MREEQPRLFHYLITEQLQVATSNYDDTYPEHIRLRKDITQLESISDLHHFLQ